MRQAPPPESLVCHPSPPVPSHPAAQLARCAGCCLPPSARSICPTPQTCQRRVLAVHAPTAPAHHTCKSFWGTFSSYQVGGRQPAPHKMQPGDSNSAATHRARRQAGTSGCCSNDSVAFNREVTMSHVSASCLASHVASLAGTSQHACHLLRLRNLHANWRGTVTVPLDCALRARHRPLLRDNTEPCTRGRCSPRGQKEDIYPNLRVVVSFLS